MRSRARSWAVAGVLSLALPVGVAAAAVAQQADGGDGVTAAVQVTQNPDRSRAHSSPQIAVNPRTGELVVAETEVRTDKRCVVHRSVDDGRSWFPGGDPHTEPFTNCSGDPINGPYTTLAFDDAGALFLAFVANDPEFDDLARSDRPRHVFLARSDDGGRTFDDASMVYEAREGEGIGATTNRRPVVALHPGDSTNVYVSWLQTGDAGEAPLAMIAASSDGGRTWDEPVDLSADDTGGYQPRTAVGADGTVHAIIPSAGFLPDLPPDERVRPVWYRQSTDGGQTWSDPVEVDPGNAGFYAGRKSILAVDGDRLVVTWYGHPETRFDPERDGTNIYVRTSADGGRTWSDRVQVNDDVDGAAEPVQTYDPGIAIAPSGRIDIAWYDFRNSPYPERFADGFSAPFNHDGFQDVYLSSSTDGGASFGPDVRITDRVINREIGVWSNNVHSHYNVGVASSDGTVYLAWQDSRNGDGQNQAEDVYFAAYRFEDTHAAAGVAGAPLWLLIGAALLLGMGLAMVASWAAVRRNGSRTADARGPA